jgi:hypothetical protein
VRRLKVHSPKLLLTLERLHNPSDRMVYILAADRYLRYKYRPHEAASSKTVGRSQILYIGTTKKGASRPATSAVNKASEGFRLRGVRTIAVHVVTCATHNKKYTWRRLEAALLDAFQQRYYQLPKYNKVRPNHVEGLFGSNALQKIIAGFDAKK